jgi:ribokinase
MACLDILIRGEKLPTWQAGARLDGLAIEGGGPVATALVAAQRLGISTGFIGTYGNDRLGAIKLQTLVENEVDTSQAVQRQNPENQVVLVAVHAKTGERIFSGFHRPSQPLEPTELDRRYITQAEILQMRELVSLVDYVICGTGFGPALTGKHDLWKAGEAILQMGPSVVVQTEGKKGSYTLTANEVFHTPAFEVDVVDTTGAGDVFHGAFLVGLLHQWSLEEIVLFSTAVAAIKCTQLSGRRGIPTFNQTLEFITSHGIELGSRI